MKSLNSEEELRWRDEVVGNAQDPLPEPWFIREARVRASDPVRDAEPLAMRYDAPEPVAAVVEPRTRLTEGPPLPPVGRSNWRWLAILAAVVVGGLLVWLFAMPKLGGAPPVATLPEDEVAAAPLPAPAPALDCASPAAIARLRDVLVGQARQAGARGIDLDGRAAALSVSIAAAPDRASGDGRTLSCGGMLSLPPMGDAAAIAAPIQYRIRPASNGAVDVSAIAGATQIVAALARAPVAAAEPVDLVPAEIEPPAPSFEVPVAATPRAAPETRLVRTPERTPVAPRTSAPPSRAIVRTEQIESRPVPRAAPPPVPRVVPPPEPRFSNASFDCSRVTSRVLEAICASPRLAALDVEMSDLFFDVRAASDVETRNDLEATRGDFIARRQSCRDDACIARVYRERIGELETYR